MRTKIPFQSQKNLLQFAIDNVPNSKDKLDLLSKLMDSTNPNYLLDFIDYHDLFEEHISNKNMLPYLQTLPLDAGIVDNNLYLLDKDFSLYIFNQFLDLIYQKQGVTYVVANGDYLFIQSDLEYKFETVNKFTILTCPSKCYDGDGIFDAYVESRTSYDIFDEMSEDFRHPQCLINYISTENKEALYGLISFTGDVLLPAEYDVIYRLAPHYYLCKKNDDYSFYNDHTLEMNQKFLFDIKDITIEDDKHQQYFLYTTHTGTQGVLDRHGNSMVAPIFKTIIPINIVTGAFICENDPAEKQDHKYKLITFNESRLIWKIDDFRLADNKLIVETKDKYYLFKDFDLVPLKKEGY